VSSAGGALKGFLLVCLAVNLVYLLAFHLCFKAFVTSFLFTPYTHVVSFLAHSSTTPAHFVVHFVQVVALVDLVFLLVLLLSRSARVVLTVLRIWLGLSLLTVVLGVVSHIYLESEWAFVTALYVLHVTSQVAGSGHASARSYRARPVLGYDLRSRPGRGHRRGDRDLHRHHPPGARRRSRRAGRGSGGQHIPKWADGAPRHRSDSLGLGSHDGAGS
jgi:hypothetical protein